LVHPPSCVSPFSVICFLLPRFLGSSLVFVFLLLPIFIMTRSASKTKTKKSQAPAHKENPVVRAPDSTNGVSTSPSSLSSVSTLVTSPNDDYLSNFVPMSLAPGMGTISEELKSSIKETLTVMSKIDFHSLSPDKNIEWNVALSKTCLRFSQDLSNLYRQMATLEECNKHTTSMREMDEFAKSTFPLIKRVSHSTFIKIIFPSVAEVTTTTPTALASYGLSSTCPLANHIFDEIVFKPHGTSNQDAITTFVEHLPPIHRYDNAAMRKELWDNYGIGSFAVKEVGRMRNTVTNLCRDATSKSHFFLFLSCTCFWLPSYCCFCSRGHFLSCRSHLCSP